MVYLYTISCFDRRCAPGSIELRASFLAMSAAFPMLVGASLLSDQHASLIAYSTLETHPDVIEKSSVTAH